MRYLTPFIRRDLGKKLVLLSGPRQCGKSTLAKSILDEKGVYLNWDIRRQQKSIRDIAWPKDASLVVLDELHKYRQWKNHLKGIIDEFGNRPPLLVTGSARLETFRHQGDALTGRTYHYRLHPIDLAESKTFLSKSSIEERLKRLLTAGGFPEAFLHPQEADRLRNDRFDVVLREDLRDVSGSGALRNMELLIELLRERVGQQISYANLARDLAVSAPAVKNWIEILRRLYLIFVVPPYSRGLARSIRKEPKIYFYDCAAAYEEAVPGARLENAVACALRKYCDFQYDGHGQKLELNYFRDREKREVDFVVIKNRRPHWAIEVKQSDDSLSTSLGYFHERAKPQESLQLVRNLTQAKEARGVKILTLGPWLESIG